MATTAAASDSMSSSETPRIWHTTLGNPSKPTLLLLHGIFCSHIEFTPLIPFLQDHFSLLLVDLPGHSRSRSTQLNTYRMAQTVSGLADLIRAQSPTGTAHVAGMSYGGFVGVELARTHPECVASLFASGSPPFERKERFLAERPWLLWWVLAATIYMPGVLFAWLCRRFGLVDLHELRKEMQANFTTQLVRIGYADCLEVTLKKVGEIHGVRSVVIAGGQQDNVDVTRRMGYALRERDPGAGCKAFVVKEAIHGWDMQFPALFAEGIRCWAEQRTMPDEFEELT